MRSTREDLEARTTINFPRYISLEELRHVFQRVSKAAPCRFTYTTKLMESIGNTDPESGEPLPDERYVENVRGTVIGQNARSASFECPPNNDYDHPNGSLTRFKKLRFLTTPGYDTIEELVGRVCDDL